MRRKGRRVRKRNGRSSTAYSKRQLRAGLSDLLPGDRENQKSRQDAGATRNRISSSDRALAGWKRAQSTPADLRHAVPLRGNGKIVLGVIDCTVFQRRVFDMQCNDEKKETAGPSLRVAFLRSAEENTKARDASLGMTAF